MTAPYRETVPVSISEERFQLLLDRAIEKASEGNPDEGENRMRVKIFRALIGGVAIVIIPSIAFGRSCAAHADDASVAVEKEHTQAARYATEKAMWEHAVEKDHTEVARYATEKAMWEHMQPSASAAPAPPEKKP